MATEKNDRILGKRYSNPSIFHKVIIDLMGYSKTTRDAPTRSQAPSQLLALPLTIRFSGLVAFKVHISRESLSLVIICETSPLTIVLEMPAELWSMGDYQVEKRFWGRKFFELYSYLCHRSCRDDLSIFFWEKNRLFLRSCLSSCSLFMDRHKRPRTSGSDTS